MAIDKPVQQVKLAIDVSLTLLKQVRAGEASVAAFSDSLKKLDSQELVLFADLARMKLSMVQMYRDMKGLL